MKVGFVGLGSMGSGMARNLIKAGFPLIVYNRTRKRAEALGELGAQVADTPAQAASGVDALITMLADDRAVRDVIFAPENAIDALHPGAVHISMSTISVALSKQLSQAHQEKKQHYVAAPVFGRPEAAASARLVVVAGGPSEQIERCRNLLIAMSQKIFVIGEEASNANVVKLSGNFLITTVIESLGEAFALARKSNIDVHKFLEILTDTLFNAPIYKTYGGMIADQKFEPPGFRLPLGFKDNRLVIAAAEDAAVPMPMANIIHDHFVEAIAQGMGNADWAAIARIPQHNAGLS